LLPLLVAEACGGACRSVAPFVANPYTLDLKDLATKV